MAGIPLAGLSGHLNSIVVTPLDCSTAVSVTVWTESTVMPLAERAEMEYCCALLSLGLPMITVLPTMALPNPTASLVGGDWCDCKAWE